MFVYQNFNSKGGDKMNYLKRNWFLLLLIILFFGYTAYTSYLVLSNDNQKVIEEQQKQISLLSDKITELENKEITEIPVLDTSTLENRISALEQAQQTITSGVESMNQAIEGNQSQIKAIWATLEENELVHSNAGETNR
ncbi:MAG: hypothetical protein [Bacteriophage sp.]|nr:MAG: hypothetical protein [Bacteriophage sp.]